MSSKNFGKLLHTLSSIAAGYKEVTLNFPEYYLCNCTVIYEISKKCNYEIISMAKINNFFLSRGGQRGRGGIYQLLITSYPKSDFGVPGIIRKMG